MAEVRLVNVSKHYNKVKVIENLNLTVRDGECFTLLGPSGCGKTVILRLIAGFERPDSGDIYIGDRLVSSPGKDVHIPTERRKIGVVFQDYAVWPHKTVFDNIVYPLKIQRVPKEEAIERTREVINQVSLAGLDKRLPFQLSGGQQQRVALGRALVSKPEIMLLDEPLCNLDANLREEMRFEIKELQRSTGATILYVTHDQEVALAISDRVAVMDETGTVRQVGTPYEIYEKPATSFVFQFMGVSNFLPVTIRNGRAFIQEAGIALPGQDIPADLISRKELVAGCRPLEVGLSRNGSAVPGTIIRKTLLGPSVDYRVRLGTREIRVQCDTNEALTEGPLFNEGDTCGLVFHNLHWFDPDSLKENVQP
ncbi:MAG: ABC transporter ATP-binding protein [Thermodesulfobacteriota bacterium]